MLPKVNGVWKNARPFVNVNGVWRDVTIGYVKVNGAWVRFKHPFVANPVTVVLGKQANTAADGSAFERRSFIRSGSGPAKGTPGAPYIGNISANSFTVEGTVYQIRGVETGSDSLGRGAWQWVSLQWFGNVPPQNISPYLVLNGIVAYRDDSGYNGDLDMTFMSYKLLTPYTQPVDTNLTMYF